MSPDPFLDYLIDLAAEQAAAAHREDLELRQ
ncbi:hypothetical protein SEA_CARON_57 [Microbacterium phage Caron]|uniref:Uncharacterized protein n=1 Tax=Microbacterium phage Caron TaxID=3028494 RepID=A0AAE9ZK27_9CAUD|nr:hypothetical protein SEA_CARON_57 [Microbacterium phage Caron]